MRSFLQSFIPSSHHSFIHSFTQLFIHPCIHCFIAGLRPPPKPFLQPRPHGRAPEIVQLAVHDGDNATPACLKAILQVHRPSGDEDPAMRNTMFAPPPSRRGRGTSRNLHTGAERVRQSVGANSCEDRGWPPRNFETNRSDPTCGRRLATDRGHRIWPQRWQLRCPSPRLAIQCA